MPPNKMTPMTRAIPRGKGSCRRSIIIPAAARQPTAGVARKLLNSDSLEGGSMLPFLAASEAYWKSLRNQKDTKGNVPTVIKTRPGENMPLPQQQGDGSTPTVFDAVVCGGTLGLFVATALQLRGHKVCIVDKRLVQGRSQEWNISRHEYEVLCRVGILSPEELEQTIVSEYNPIRVGFKEGPELWVRDCLNIGVSPRGLLDLVKGKFLAAGGFLLEETEFRRAEVYSDGVRMQMGPAGGGARKPLTVGDSNRPNAVAAEAAAEAARAAAAADADVVVENLISSTDGYSSSEGGFRPNSQGVVLHTRLLLDCMGHYSSIVKQMRGKRKPDGIVMVVGSCAEGFPDEANNSADLLYTFTDAEQDMQLFWEAFPAESGQARTTYMFSYTDAEPSRPSFEEYLETYFQLLPQYQGVPLESLTFKRILFGAFPCYSDGPLQPVWDRVMQIGDASCAQSPLSFGGFGSMMRHLPRLATSLDQALKEGRLSCSDLTWCHPYQPSLSASWLFQRSMSVNVGQLQAQGQATQGSNGKVTKSNYPSWALLPPTQVNSVLAANFAVMRVLGDRVLKPFLQDTIQLVPLGLSMAGMLFRDPVSISRVFVQVGPVTLFSWFGHYLALVAYTVLYLLLKPIVWLAPRQIKESFEVCRLMEALEFGAGLDYSYQAPSLPPPSGSTASKAVSKRDSSNGDAAAGKPLAPVAEAQLDSQSAQLQGQSVLK